LIGHAIGHDCPVGQLERALWLVARLVTSRIRLKSSRN